MGNKFHYLFLKNRSPYLQKNSDISLGQLIREENAQKILKASAYKPGL